MSPPGPSDRPLRRVGETSLWLLVIGVLVYAVVRLAAQLQLVVLASLFALVLATLLTPPAAWLRRRRWPPAAAAAGVLAGFLLLIAAVGAWIVPSVSGQLGDLEVSLTGGLREVERWLIEGPFALSEQQVSSAVDRLEQTVRDNVGNFARGAVSGATLLLEVVGGLVLGLVLLFFLLKDGAEMWRWVVGLSAPRYRDDVRAAGERAWSGLAAFFRAQTFVALFDATFIGLGLVILGVPLALPLAVLTFFAAYVPYLGAITAGAAAVLVALVSQGGVTALLVLGVVIVVQQAEGNVMQPLIMGRALSVHPVVILLGVTAGGLLGGIVGAVVAAPVLAAASGVFGHVRERLTEPGDAAAEPATAGEGG